MKKSLGIFALTFSIILVSSIILLSISFASAETVGQQIVGKLGTLGNPLQGLNLTEDGKLSLAKWMLVFLLAIIVYAITTFLPFFPENKPWLQWVFAIVIAILGFLFVTPGEIKLLLTNYQALGIALTTIIPLLIIVTFTYELRKNKADVATFVNKPLVILFLLYVFVSWLNLRAEQASGGLGWIYMITMVATLIWLIAEKRIVRQAIKNQGTNIIDKAKDVIRKATAADKLKAQQLKELGTEEAGSGI